MDFSLSGSYKRNKLPIGIDCLGIEPSKVGCLRLNIFDKKSEMTRVFHIIVIKYG